MILMWFNRARIEGGDSVHNNDGISPDFGTLLCIINSCQLSPPVSLELSDVLSTPPAVRLLVPFRERQPRSKAA